MEEPRWLADAMLGRLARYLRFLGHDTAYVQGADDREVAERALREHRVLLTRDRDLAARVPGALLLSSREIGDQFRAVREAHPDLVFHVRFERCSLCNGILRAWEPVQDEPLPIGLPANVPGSPSYFRCEACGHLFWEGTHTAAIRASIAGWLHA